MKLSTLMLLIVPLATVLLSYILIQLNPEIIPIDLLFFDIEIRIGILVTFSFLLGTLFALLLEFINYFRVNNLKNKNK